MSPIHSVSPIVNHQPRPEKSELTIHSEVHTWSSPAFLKRKRSVDPSFGKGFNPFNDNDEDFEDTEKKRSRYSRPSAQWRFAERAPSPEKDITDNPQVTALSDLEPDIARSPIADQSPLYVGDETILNIENSTSSPPRIPFQAEPTQTLETEDLQPEVGTDIQEDHNSPYQEQLDEVVLEKPAVEEISQIGVSELRSQVTDESTQTKAEYSQTGVSSRSSEPPLHIDTTIATPQLTNVDEINADFQPPDSPRLRPLPSPDLPMVSPFLSRKGKSQYFEDSNFDTVSSEQSNQHASNEASRESLVSEYENGSDHISGPEPSYQPSFFPSNQQGLRSIEEELALSEAGDMSLLKTDEITEMPDLNEPLEMPLPSKDSQNGEMDYQVEAQIQGKHIFPERTSNDEHHPDTLDFNEVAYSPRQSPSNSGVLFNDQRGHAEADEGLSETSNTNHKHAPQFQDDVVSSSNRQSQISGETTDERAVGNQNTPADSVDETLEELDVKPYNAQTEDIQSNQNSQRMVGIFIEPYVHGSSALIDIVESDENVTENKLDQEVHELIKQEEEDESTHKEYKETEEEADHNMDEEDEERPGEDDHDRDDKSNHSGTLSVEKAATIDQGNQFEIIDLESSDVEDVESNDDELRELAERAIRASELGYVRIPETDSSRAARRRTPEEVNHTMHSIGLRGHNQDGLEEDGDRFLHPTIEPSLDDTNSRTVILDRVGDHISEEPKQGQMSAIFYPETALKDDPQGIQPLPTLPEVVLRMESPRSDKATPALKESRQTPKPSPKQALLNYSDGSRSVTPNRRVPGTRRTEDIDYDSLLDYCPPFSTLSASNLKALQTDWASNNPLDLSNDSDRYMLHEVEVVLASTLRLTCATYLCSKRRIFEACLRAFENGKDFRKTDAQHACKIDVNKASKLWAVYDKVGWFSRAYFEQYLSPLAEAVQASQEENPLVTEAIQDSEDSVLDPSLRSQISSPEATLPIEEFTRKSESESTPIEPKHAMLTPKLAEAQVDGTQDLPTLDQSSNISTIERLKSLRTSTRNHSHLNGSTSTTMNQWFTPTKSGRSTSTSEYEIDSEETSNESSDYDTGHLQEIHRESLPPADSPETEYPFTEVSDTTISKGPLSGGFRTALSYYISLSTASEYFDTKIDTVAIVVSSTNPVRATSGPRDFYQTMYLTDTSTLSRPKLSTAQIFRPSKDALPLIQSGDAILLRDFKIQAQNRGFMLLSTDSSAWAVFRQGEDVQIRGPPVELGVEEKEFAKGLRRWWDNLKEGGRDEVKRLVPKPPTKEKRKAKAPKAKDNTAGRHGTRSRTTVTNRPLVHELRDGTTWKDEL